jgi:hypothetical protein
MNNFDAFVKVLLSGRVHRDVKFDDSLLHTICNEFFEQLAEDKPHFIVCNTIQNKSCFMLANKNPVIIFDYYNINIMQYLNKISASTLKQLIEPWFHKILSEYMYVSGYSYASKTCFDKWNNNVVSDTADNTDMLEVQQVFVLYHELYHYIFYVNPDKLRNQLDETSSDLSGRINYIQSEFNRKKTNEIPDDKIKYYQESGMHEYVIETLKKDGIPPSGNEFDDMRKYMDQISSLEECMCDKYASIKAFEWGIKNRSLAPEVCMSYICSALNNQFLISYIYEFFKGDILAAAYSELNMRLYYTYFVIYNHAIENHIAIDDTAYDKALSYEIERDILMFEVLVNLSLKQMDLGLPDENLKISNSEREALLLLLKKSTLD